MNFQSTAEENALPFPPKLDSLINIQTQFGNDTDKVKLLNEIAWHYVVVNTDSGLQYGYDALKLASSLGWKKGAADAYNNIGESLRFKGDIENSLRNHRTALNIFESINDIHGKAHSLSQIGISYYYLSNLSISYEYFYKALSLYREFNDKDGIAKNLSYMGIIQSNLKEYELAIEHFTNSINIYNELNEKQKIAVQLGNIGIVYYELKDYLKALEIFEQALSLFDEFGDIYSKSFSLSNVGLVYTALSDYEKAESSLSEALKISTQLNDKEGIAYQYGNIGKLYLKKAEDNALEQSGQIKSGLISRSIEYLEKSVELLDSLSENIERKEFLFSLSQAYKLKNNFQKAFEIFATATLIKDSILTSESKKQIAELEIKQQLDLREKELELLNAKNDYQRIITNSLIGFVSIITVSTVIIFILYLRIKNDNRSLNENIRLRKEIEESLRQNEEELKKYHEHLEELVNERTKELEKEITERIEIENSLRKSEERYELAVEGAELGTWDWDIPSGKVIYGGKYLEMLGYSKDEFKPTLDSWENAIHPEDRQYVLSSLQDHLDGKTELYKTEYRFKTKTGDWKWILDVGKIVERDDKGKPLRAAGIHHDVTERKHFDQAIRESEIRFRSIFDNVINIAVQGYLEDGTGHYWNKASETLYGYSSEEAVGNSLYDLIIPDEAVEEVKKAVKNMFETEISIPSEELLLKKKDGSLVPVYRNHTIISIPGKRKEMYCIDLDLSDLKKSEELYKESEKKYRNLFESNKDGITIIYLNEDNTFSDIVEVNTASAEMLGYSKEEVINKLPTIFEKDLTIENVNKRLHEIRFDGISQFETILIHKEGIDVHVDITAVKINYNNRIAIMNIIRNVTERKLSEIQLRENQQQLAEANRFLQSVLDTVPVRIFWKNKDSVYLGGNKLFAFDAGKKSPEEIIGLDDFSLPWNDRAEIYRSDDYEVISTGAIKLNYEEPKTSLNGNVDWLRTSKVPLMDINQNIVGVLGIYEDVTKEKHAKEALIESEERYKSLFNNNHSVMLLIDPATGKIIDANKAACDYYGWNRSLMITKKITEINTLTENEVFIEMEAARSQKRKQFIFKHRLANDEIRDVEVFSGSVIIKSKTYLYSIVHDITDKKLIEKALVESEKKYRYLFSHNPQPMIIYEIESLKLLEVNNAAIGKYGYTRDEFLSMTIKDIRPAEDVPLLLENIKSTNKSLNNAGEWRHLTKDGSIRIVEISSHTVTFDGKNARLVLINDITERKESEKLLRESEEKFRELSDLLPQIVFEIDLQGKLTFVNKIAFDYFGYSKEEYENGLNALEMISPEDRERALQNINRILNNGEILSVEYNAIRKDGSIFPVIIFASIVIKDGLTVGLRGIIVDISEQKRLEKEIRSSLKEKEVLLKEVHHRVKNNFQLISNMLSLESDLLSDEKINSVFNELQVRIRSLSLVHEILYTTKDFGFVNIRDYVTDLIEFLQRSLLNTYQQIDIKLNIEDEVYLEPDIIIPCGLIINELVSNSVKYAFPERNNGLIKIEIKRKNNKHIINISDNGIGLPVKFDIDKVQSFGLFLVRTLSQQMKGELSFKSSSEGSEFTIIF